MNLVNFTKHFSSESDFLVFITLWRMRLENITWNQFIINLYSWFHGSFGKISKSCTIMFSVFFSFTKMLSKHEIRGKGCSILFHFHEKALFCANWRKTSNTYTRFSECFNGSSIVSIKTVNYNYDFTFLSSYTKVLVRFPITNHTVIFFLEIG